ncbi:hypothetical protein [Cupriavidus necator]|uniref:hypothetical protein n=1 Tax=Cupriavidus necator TaxID=106590 RepID=UPI003F740508
MKQATARRLQARFTLRNPLRLASAMFRHLKKRSPSRKRIDNHVTHVVPIIADIDTGFSNAIGLGMELSISRSIIDRAWRPIVSERKPPSRRRR